jgi:ABC-type Fe3+/spermidine/putrescine transport system ATPase subunit
MLELVRLQDFGQRKPRQLSGGQQQRVALARALITHPKVLLLDEPLGALDKRLRETMQIELKQIQREVGLTTIFVTHDQEEALTLSDRIAIIDHGRLIQVGSPDDVYERPRTKFAAGFLGDANFFQGRVTAANRVRIDDNFELTTTDTLPATGSMVTLALRPEKILLLPETGSVPADLVNQLNATIRQVVYSGNSNRYIVDAAGSTLTAFEQNRSAQRFSTGSRATLAWAARHLVVVQV